MIRKLTILRTRVRADVQIGENEFGGAVVVTVELPRNAQEVQDASASLENLLLRTAQEHVKASSDRQVIDKEVRAAVAVQIEKERERLRRNGAAESAHRIRRLENDLGNLQSSKDRVIRDRDDAMAQAERLRVRVNELDAQLREASKAQQQQGEQVTTT